MPTTVNIHYAKTHLSRLLERVRRGATITIAKAGTPIARLVPLGETPAPRRVKEPTTLPEAVLEDRQARLTRLLELEVWPSVPEAELGRRLSRDEEDDLLGYGPAGT